MKYSALLVFIVVASLRRFECCQPGAPPVVIKPPEEEEPGSVIDKLLGKNIDIGDYPSDRYVSEGGGPVIEEGLLDCDFDGECCWRNAEPPEDKLQWQVGKTKPNATKIIENFGGVTQLPKDNYLLVVSPAAQDPYYEARFVSCSISCTDLEVKVKLRHWTSDDVELQVCTRNAAYGEEAEVPLLNCVNLPRESSPGPTEVILPPGEFFDVVIVARNFFYNTGGAAIIDDVEVQYTICSDIAGGFETTPTAPTESTEAVSTPSTTAATTEEPTDPPTTPSEGGTAEECESVPCNFEADNSCAYSQFSDDSNANTPFAVRTGRFKNWVTGIARAAEGDSYLAAYLFPSETAVLESFVDLQQDRMIVYKAYDGTQDMVLEGCCDSVSNCKAMIPGDKSRDARQWKEQSFICPKGTQSIVFHCANYGSNQGACGLDDIRMFVVEGGQKQENACT